MGGMELIEWREVGQALRFEDHDLDAIDENRRGNVEMCMTQVYSYVISDQRAQEMIDEAMARGTVKQRNVVGVVTGLMGSGKTMLLHHLFGLPPPGLYTSTGVADQSFRSLLHHTVHMSAGAWKRISHQDIRAFIAHLIEAGMKSTDVNALSARILQARNQADNNQPPPLPSSPLPLSTASTSHTQDDRSVLHGSPACKKLLTIVKVESSSGQGSEHGLEEMVLELVLMIDTGGQPELMEVMPTLIHNADLALILVNLEYSLDKCPNINLHLEGVCYERRFSSQFTSRDNLLKLVSTLRAKKLLHEPFRMLIIATHRDCVQDDLEERVDALNRELQIMLLPTFQDELIIFEALDKIAFVLNLKNPDDDDKEALGLIRYEIGKPGLGGVFDTPTSFFVFEQDLLQFAESEAKRDILSLDECKMVGARIPMSQEMVVAALVLFHCQNTFLYFRHVLPNHVFIKPQVPLDIVNGIVRFSYRKFRCVPAKLVALLKDGIITEELLSYDQISDHFQKGFYEVHDAIKLFCHTFILAPLLPEKAHNTIREEEKQYLMMCLKPPIPEGELESYVPKSSDVVPLIVKFSCGCVPLGCFGCTISCLLSKYHFEVVRKDGSPKCLAHNIASLRDPELLVKILLIDFTKHIEIHVDSNFYTDDSPSDICPQVCEKVLEAIEKVFETMHINTEVIKISPAVICPCGEVAEKHFADFVNRKGKHFLLCESSKSPCRRPDEKHLVWMSGLVQTDPPKGNPPPVHPTLGPGLPPYHPPPPLTTHPYQPVEVPGLYQNHPPRVQVPYQNPPLGPFQYQQHPHPVEPPVQHVPYQQPPLEHVRYYEPPQESVPYQQPPLVHQQPPLEKTPPSKYRRYFNQSSNQPLLPSRPPPQTIQNQTLPQQATPPPPSAAQPQLRDLTRELKDVAWSDLRALCIQLGVEYAVLENIEHEKSRVSDRLSAAMNAWLTTKAASWKKVVRALKSIRQNVLAKKIEQSWVLETGDDR